MVAANPVCVLSLSVMVLLMLPAAHADPVQFPEGTDSSQPYLDPPALPAEVKTNLMLVDGTTGAIIDTENRGGGGNWTVKVVGLDPHVTSLGLKNPLQTKLFVGAKSTAAGYVQFPQVRLMTGVHTVFRATALTDVVVVTFNTAGIPTTLNSNSGGAGGGNNEAPGNECHEGVIRQEIIGINTQWTPLLVVGSPYLGQAHATTAFTDSDATFVFNWGYYSRLQTGPGLSVGAGHSRGVFQLVEWSEVEQTYQRMDCNTFQRWSYLITDPEPTGSRWTKTFSLTGTRMDTSADDLTRVSADGYGSIIFDFRYKQPPNANIDTAGGGQSWTVGEGSGYLWNTGVDVGWHHPNSPVDVSFGAFRGERESGVTSTYVYEFPASGKWNVTYKGGSEGVWAFCYRYGNGAC